MTKSLERRASREHLRSYELDRSPEEAIEPLRRRSKPPILNEEQAAKRRSLSPFIMLNEAGFTLFKPWGPRVTVGEALFPTDITVGPALVGRMRRTARGARLEISVKRFAITPAQRFEVARAVVGLGAFILAPIVFAGLNPVALAFAAFMLFGVLGSVLLYRRRQREDDIRELLAIVEGAYGPLELPAASDSPRRRDHPLDPPPSGDG